MEAVAEILSCTERHIYNLITDGKIEAIKVGTRAVRISEKSLYSFIESARINPEDLFDPDRDKPKEQKQPVAKSRWMSKP